MLQQRAIYFNNQPRNEKKDQKKISLKKNEDLVVEVKRETPQQKFERILSRSSETLLHIKTHFPLELEPKEVMVDIT